ncbi:putative phosphoenolpyruvate synthase [Paratrimastix pyriformis]|uniref:Phosphoenolpyruvate synthase n=1 Tax=Paratrimastix pyriformis TaxID=342808 RepID=A0ABQ8UQS6_9EUKA|nr:putative phosphoenolpyruvate synthase [Paratrimastix pyriformis]
MLIKTSKPFSFLFFFFEISKSATMRAQPFGFTWLSLPICSREGEAYHIGQFVRFGFFIRPFHIFFSEEEVRRKTRALNLMGCGEGMVVQTDELMKIRVQKILVLVNNEYDFFLLEEDGGLAEQLHSTFMDLNLTHMPTMVRAVSLDEAIAKLRGAHETYELVISVHPFADAQMLETTRILRIHARTPHVYSVVTDLHAGTGAHTPGTPAATPGGGTDGVNPALDTNSKVFLWNGDPKLMLSLIKLTEDALNVDADTKAGVRVILYVEDNPKYYSAYLPLLYHQLMDRTGRGQGLNPRHMLARKRTRPKVLFANTYHEAAAYVQRYRTALLGIISDIEFPLGPPQPALPLAIRPSRSVALFFPGAGATALSPLPPSPEGPLLGAATPPGPSPSPPTGTASTGPAHGSGGGSLVGISPPTTGHALSPIPCSPSPGALAGLGLSTGTTLFPGTGGTALFPGAGSPLPPSPSTHPPAPALGPHALASLLAAASPAPVPLAAAPLMVAMPTSPEGGILMGSVGPAPRAPAMGSVGAGSECAGCPASDSESDDEGPAPIQILGAPPEPEVRLAAPLCSCRPANAAVLIGVLLPLPCLALPCLALPCLALPCRIRVGWVGAVWTCLALPCHIRGLGRGGLAVPAQGACEEAHGGSWEDELGLERDPESRSPTPPPPDAQQPQPHESAAWYPPSPATPVSAASSGLSPARAAPPPSALSPATTAGLPPRHPRSPPPQAEAAPHAVSSVGSLVPLAGGGHEGPALVGSGSTSAIPRKGSAIWSSPAFDPVFGAAAAAAGAAATSSAPLPPASASASFVASSLAAALGLPSPAALSSAGPPSSTTPLSQPGPSPALLGSVSTAATTSPMGTPDGSQQQQAPGPGAPSESAICPDAGFRLRGLCPDVAVLFISSADLSKQLEELRAARWRRWLHAQMAGQEALGGRAGWGLAADVGAGAGSAMPVEEPRALAAWCPPDPTDLLLPGVDGQDGDVVGKESPTIRDAIARFLDVDLCFAEDFVFRRPDGSVLTIADMRAPGPAPPGSPMPPGLPQPAPSMVAFWRQLAASAQGGAPQQPGGGPGAGPAISPQTPLTTALGTGRYACLPGGLSKDPLRVMLDMLDFVPDECIAFHGARNHFRSAPAPHSILTLPSHPHPALAQQLDVRPGRVRPGALPAAVPGDSFHGADRIRGFLRRAILTYLDKHTRGMATTFDPALLGDSRFFMKLGSGSLGGKARGLLFLEHTLPGLEQSLEGFLGAHTSTPFDFLVATPRTLVLPTNIFECFVRDHHLQFLCEFPAAPKTGPQAAPATPGGSAGPPGGWDGEESLALARGRTGRVGRLQLPEVLLASLRDFLGQMEAPLAVRSSSMFEDSRREPLSGIYATYLLPNSQPDLGRRLGELSRAIRLVYASTYCNAARSYRTAVGINGTTESMAVIIQEVAGSLHRGPLLPGHDGIATVVLGLGGGDGATGLKFCPGNTSRSFAHTAQEKMRQAQQTFAALQVGEAATAPTDPADLRAHVRPYGMPQAEEDGVLGLVGSYYDLNEGALKSYWRGCPAGPRVVTFTRQIELAQYSTFPLPAILHHLLQKGEAAVGGPVEIEFAVNLAPDRPLRGGTGTFIDRTRSPAAPASSPAVPPELILLQMRPLVIQAGPAVSARTLARAGGLPRGPLRPLPPGAGPRPLRAHPRHPRPHPPPTATPAHLPHTRTSTAHPGAAVVVVKRAGFDPMATRAIAEEVGRLNEALLQAGLPYMAIGMGRWGTSQPSLGIPVKWDQVRGARVLVETGTAAFVIDPSSGTHFLDHVMQHRIPVLYVQPLPDGSGPEPDWLDWGPIEAALLPGGPAAAAAGFTVVSEGPHVAHLRCPEPLTVAVDGTQRRAVIVRGQQALADIMTQP